MGYFSRLATELSERAANCREEHEPTRIERLEMRLQDLKDKLEWLEEIRPHDPLYPKYDYYFYEDTIGSCFGDAEPEEDAVRFPYTVEGLNRAIREVKEQIEELHTEKIEGVKFMISVFLTGMTPEGQCALTDVFDPTPYGITVAA